MPEEAPSSVLNSFLPVDRITEQLGVKDNIETLPVQFFVHDGSDARPSHIPNNVRVLYVHKSDGAFVITHSNKLRSWRAVTKYLPLGDAQFRTFALSKSRYAR